MSLYDCCLGNKFLCAMRRGDKIYIDRTGRLNHGINYVQLP